MQKRLMIIAVLLLAICNKIAAADQVTISEFRIFTSQTKDVSISLTNDKAYAAFQFDLVLPEGVTVVMPESPETWNDHKSDRIPSTTDLSMQQLSDGSYRFVAIPGTTTIENISGSEGVIINLTLSAAATAAVGNQTGYFRNIKLSTSDGVAANGNTISEQSFTFAVLDGEPYVVYDGTNKKLTFYYDAYKIDRNGTDLSNTYWLNYNRDFKTVEFHSSFAKYKGLTSTSQWFYSCEYLEEVIGISNLVTDDVTNMNSMFRDCPALTTLDLSSFRTEKVEYMEQMFSGCTGLTSVDISSFKTENVKDMSLLFANCSSLSSVNISKFNTLNAQYIYGMFSGCSSLTSLDVSALETDNQTTLMYMFERCSSLTQLDLSNFNTEKVKYMGNLFYGCSNLETIYVGSKWSTTSVEDSENMFEGCTKLVGGIGTVYDENKTSHTYAHIDGGADDPGYLTGPTCDLKVAVVGNGQVKVGTTVIESNTENTLVVETGESMGLTITPADGYKLQSFVVDMIDYTQEIELRIENDEDVAIDIDRYHSIIVTFVNDTSEPYAVLSDENKTLTFYYDKQKATKNGMDIVVMEGIDDVISAAWHNEASSITKVVIDKTMNSCTSLTSTAYWFYGFSSLESIDLTNLNTENVKDMKYMFAHCSSLTSIPFGDINTANVESMAGMFEYSSSLQSLDLTKFNTAKVKSMSSMFEGCDDLAAINLDVSKFNTENVTAMNNMFYRCGSLTNIDLSGFNTAKVTNMYMMFNDCNNLTSLDLGSLNTAAVTDMGRMFWGCNKLTTIYVSDKWSTASAGEDVANVFYDCSSIVGGEGTTYDANKVSSAYARIDDPANNKPGYLTDVIYKGVEDEPYAVLTSNGDEITTSESTVNGKTLTFYYDKKKVAISDAITIVPFSNISEVGWIGSNDVITKVVFDDSFADCTSLTSTAYWFYGCTNLATITGIGNLKTENVTSMQSMFESCTSLTELDLTGFSTSKVTNMSRMFNSCSGLTSLDLSHFDVSSVLDMSSMFYDCRALTSINLSNWVTSKNTSMNMMFMKCSGLTELDLGSFNTASVTDMYHMFAHSYNLKTIYIGSGWTTSKVENGTEMFYGCSELVGGEGTLYSLAYTNYDYAVIDGGTTAPGYLTNVIYKGVEDEPYAVLTDNSDVVTTDYDTTTGKTLTFYYDKKKTTRGGMGVGPFADSFGVEWYDNRQSISSVVFDDSFASYTALTSTAYWFDGFKNLSNISGISNLKTNSVTNMDNMFRECKSLTDIDLENFTTDEVTSMRMMFAECSGLTTLDVRSFKTEKVEDFSGMFSQCSNLTTIDLSNFDTQNAVNIGYLFQNCTKIESLNFPKFNTSKVDDFSGLFWGCEGLTTLDLSNFNTSAATKMNYIFYYSSNLKTIYVRDSWTTANVVEGVQAFSGCSNLVGGKGSTINDMPVDYTYARIDGGPDNPGYLTDVIYKDAVDEPYAVMSDGNKTMTFYYDKEMAVRGGMSALNYWEWDNYRESISQVVFDETMANCTSLTSTAGWFKDCSKLTTITGIANLKTENVSEMQQMFQGCSSLTSLDLSTFDTQNVITMFNMFGGCSSLTSITLSNFDTKNVEYLGNMFRECSSLSTLDLSSFTTPKVTNIAAMFYGCTNLTTIYVSDNWYTELVTEGTSMFAGCQNLVGGKGTVFDANHTDYGYAHIDGGPSSETPGYFTDIDAPASYEVKVRAVGNGQVTIDRVVVSSNNEEIVTVDRGSAITMVFTPDEGYKLESVVVDNTDVTSELEAYNETGAKIYTLDRIYDYHKVTATFANNTVTLTAKSYTRKYGEENPEFEYTTEGADFSGKPTITCEATDTTSVGTYPIVITYTEPAGTRAAIATDETSSLNVVCVNGTLTITKTPLKVAAKSYTIKRGSPIPTFEIEYAGFVNNETETVFTKKAEATCEAKSDTVPGTYQIVVSGAEAKNYEMEYVNGSLTITDDVVVTAKSYTREYGEANPTFEYTVDGAILEGTPAITCEATATSPVGTYDITIAKGDITNSDVTYVKGTLTITKAPLTITAKSYSIKQGKDLPTLELEYSGFKNNETDTVFTTKPTVTTRATSYSNPGTYDIIVSGAEAANYEIKYVNGTLTITEKTESFDGYVLRVNEGGNIDDAFENMGGREEAAKTIAAIIWNASDPLTDEMLEGIDNPNLLVYVSDKKHAPKSVKNIVVGGEAQYISLTDDSTKNCNFYVPEEFVADSIVYTREFKQTTKKNVSRGWEGIVLPFTVQTFSHETHGEIAPFGNTASKYHFWLHAITEDGVIDATTIEANKPYIISMPNSEEYTAEFNQAGLVTFASADVKVPATETMDVWLGDSVVIIPTLQRVEKYDMIYALNVLYDFDDYKEGSVFVSNYRDIRPFEIYTFHERHHHEGAGARFISLSSLFGGSDNTTGIIPSIDVDQNGEVWFDMNGRRLQSKPARKGVYIMNGKKVVIK